MPTPASLPSMTTRMYVQILPPQTRDFLGFGTSLHPVGIFGIRGLILYTVHSDSLAPNRDRLSTQSQGKPAQRTAAVVRRRRQFLPISSGNEKRVFEAEDDDGGS